MSNPAEIVHGPMFVGFMFNVFLFGIMVTQVYIYFTTYKDDKNWMKIFVFVLLAADTANTVFDFTYLYQSLIVNFGNVTRLANSDWIFATDPAITGIIATLVQLFFAWRIRILTNSWSLAFIVFLGALSGVAGAVATSFEVGRTPQFVDFRDFKGVVIVWLLSESITDILITTILVTYFFRRHRHKTGFKQSDYLVDRIIRLTVQTGLVTSIIATLDLILFLVYPNGTHLIFNFPLCKLYTNSLMSSLNARAGWRYASTSAASLGTDALPSMGDAALLEKPTEKRRSIAHIAQATLPTLNLGLGPERPAGTLSQGAKTPTRSLSMGAGVMAPFTRSNTTMRRNKTRPEVHVQIDVDRDVDASSHQLERAGTGRGAGPGGATTVIAAAKEKAREAEVPIRTSRSESAVVRGSRSGSGVAQSGQWITKKSSSKVFGDDVPQYYEGNQEVECKGREKKKKKASASAEDLMRQLDLDLGMEVSPSRLEAGQRRLS